MNRERVVAHDGGEIQITEENKVLAQSIKRRLDNEILPSTASGCSIYRVPIKIRKLSSYAYTPSKTSIGPFHHGKCDRFDQHDKLIDYKSRHVREVLSRNTPMGTNMLEVCVEYVKRIENKVRRCYSEPINLSGDEFVVSMVIDGLFMIELFLKYAHNGKKIAQVDPMVSVVDLFLLENQIPMVVLDCLFNVLALKKELSCETLNVLALQFFDQLMPRGEKVIRTNFAALEGKHVLDLLHKTYLHGLPVDGKAKKTSCISIPSATELKRVGVKFVVAPTKGSLLDIKFKNGVMEIPPMNLMNKYERVRLLQNLIAYELCSYGKVAYYMTSYVFLMDSLIKSEQDVRILRKHKILTGWLSDRDVSGYLTYYFKKLCSEVILTAFYYSELCEKVNSYYEIRSNACAPKLCTVLLKLDTILSEVLS